MRDFFATLFPLHPAVNQLIRLISVVRHGEHVAEVVRAMARGCCNLSLLTRQTQVSAPPYIPLSTTQGKATGTRRPPPATRLTFASFASRQSTPNFEKCRHHLQQDRESRDREAARRAREVLVLDDAAHLFAHAALLDVHFFQRLYQLRRDGIDRGLSLLLPKVAVAGGVILLKLGDASVLVWRRGGLGAALAGKAHECGAQAVDRDGAALAREGVRGRHRHQQRDGCAFRA
mmetsp:Transcript_9909/g.32543  ORF Transcript_9909/g.32543 Transcript_9909/m.32543 type:complete len:232 (+) Transcript_9909:238-933(+)